MEFENMISKQYCSGINSERKHIYQCFQEKMQHKKIRKEKNYHGDSYIAKDLKIIIVTPT